MTWIVSETVDKRLSRLSQRICDSGGSDKAAVEQHRKLCQQYVTRIQPDLSHIPDALRYDSQVSAIDPRHREAAANMMQRKHLVHSVDLLRRLLAHCGDAPITIQAMIDAGQSNSKTARSRLQRLTAKNLLSRQGEGIYTITPQALELMATL